MLCRERMMCHMRVQHVVTERLAIDVSAISSPAETINVINKIHHDALKYYFVPASAQPAN